MLHFAFTEITVGTAIIDIREDRMRRTLKFDDNLMWNNVTAICNLIILINYSINYSIDNINITLLIIIVYSNACLY